ncbi:hypothetical protein, partial [Escherichia coli]|uniref:hypothetical protein n=1 Tax=Escherichia coli TaxID=562 RepID=UPI00195477CC
NSATRPGDGRAANLVYSQSIGGLQKRIYVIAAAFLAAAISNAGAADIVTPRGPAIATVVAPAFNWSGFYLGGHAAALFGQT